MFTKRRSRPHCVSWQVGACGEEAGAARGGKDLADRQGEKQQLNSSPRSYLEAAPLSSRATNSSRVPSAASYSAADWASSKGEGDEEGDEEHGSELLDSSADDEHGVTLRRSGRNHRTDAKRVRSSSSCMVEEAVHACMHNPQPTAVRLTDVERWCLLRSVWCMCPSLPAVEADGWRCGVGPLPSAEGCQGVRGCARMLGFGSSAPFCESKAAWPALWRAMWQQAGSRE